MEFNLLSEFIRSCILRRNIRWKYHTNMRLASRYISRATILDLVDSAANLNWFIWDLPPNPYEIFAEEPKGSYLQNYLALSINNDGIFYQIATVFTDNSIVMVKAYRATANDSKKPSGQEGNMICHNCDGQMKKTVTDMPFKTTPKSIIIIKDLPILQCPNCREYQIEDHIMGRLDQLLSKVEESSELKILKFPD